MLLPVHDIYDLNGASVVFFVREGLWLAGRTALTQPGP